MLFTVCLFISKLKIKTGDNDDQKKNKCKIKQNKNKIITVNLPSNHSDV